MATRGRKQDRWALLGALYDASGGDVRKEIDAYKLGSRLGLDVEVTGVALKRWFDLGALAMTSRGARITKDGLDLVEARRAKAEQLAGESGPAGASVQGTGGPGITLLPLAYVGSAQKGAEALRSAAIVACLRAKVFPEVMESWSAEPRKTVEALQRRIAGCDVAIILVGSRYGSLVPDETISFTEYEYREARRQGKPVLAFASSKVELEAGALDEKEFLRLRDFRAALSEWLQGEFDTPDKLETLVYQAVAEWRREWSGESSLGIRTPAPGGILPKP